MRTFVLSAAALAGVALTADPAAAQYRVRGRVVVAGPPVVVVPHPGVVQPIAPVVPQYVAPVMPVAPVIGRGYNFYPGNRFSTYPGWRYWW